MSKPVSRGRPISVYKDVEVEVDVYLDEFETDELLGELKRRKDFVDYKALYEELGWYVERLRTTKRDSGYFAASIVNDLLLAYQDVK